FRSRDRAFLARRRTWRSSFRDFVHSPCWPASRQDARTLARVVGSASARPVIARLRLRRRPRPLTARRAAQRPGASRLRARRAHPALRVGSPRLVSLAAAFRREAGLPQVSAAWTT